jgi:hypothetical protein
LQEPILLVPRGLLHPRHGLSPVVGPAASITRAPASAFPVADTRARVSGSSSFPSRRRCRLPYSPPPNPASNLLLPYLEPLQGYISQVPRTTASILPPQLDRIDPVVPPRVALGLSSPPIWP